MGLDLVMVVSQGLIRWVGTCWDVGGFHPLAGEQAHKKASPLALSLGASPASLSAVEAMALLHNVFRRPVAVPADSLFISS